MTEGTIEERIVELQSKEKSLIVGAMGGASKGALTKKKVELPTLYCSHCVTYVQDHIYL